MKKIIIIMISLLFLTACSVKYDLTINEDLSIIEEASLTGTQDFFANYYKTTKKNVVKSFLEQYQDILKEKGYQYEFVDDDIPFVNVKKTYDNISNYTKGSLLFNDYFDEVKYTEDGNLKRIETIGFNDNNPEDPNRFDIKKLSISITCPYKVKNHNAKRVDDKTNTYYYELDNSSDYKILLEFDVSKKFNKYENMLITVAICFLIIIFTWVIVYILNKKKNN